MKLMNEYISGDKFSNSYDYQVPEQEKHLLIRPNYLAHQVAGKKVLHLGCVDHLPLIEQKIKDHNWLHAILDSSASRCLGIDINEEGLNFMRGLGYQDVVKFDFVNEPTPEIVKSDFWDFAVLGEVLEHTDNPVEFLQAIRQKLSGHCKEIIITVPNAFFYLNFIKGLKGIEYINTDHRYWFSPYTLQKVACRAGYKNLRIKMITGGMPQKRIWRTLTGRRPIFCDTVLLCAEL